jgi:hypothetical protein
MLLVLMCQSVKWPKSHNTAGRIKSIKQSNNIARERINTHPACSIVHLHQPSTSPRAPNPRIVCIHAYFVSQRSDWRCGRASWGYRTYLCKIWGLHGGDYEEWCLLGCYAVWLL